MKLIDEYTLNLLKHLEVSRESSFTGFNIAIKNKKTRSDRLKFLLKKKLLIQERGLYRMTERGIKFLKILEKAEAIIGEDPKSFYENYDRVSYIFRNYLNSYVSLLKKNFNNNLISVILYGSVARGKWTYESDIDLLLIFSDEIVNLSGFNKTLTNITVTFEKTLQLKDGNNKTIYCSLQEYPIFLNDLDNIRTLFYDIAMDGIILYDRANVGFSFIERINQRIVNKNIKRIFVSDKDFYWKRNNVEFGELIEL